MIRGFIASTLLLLTGAAWAEEPPVGAACDASFSAMKTSDVVNPTSFSAWALVPGLDIHRTMEKFKALGTANGFDLSAETYYGAQGSLLMTKRSAFSAANGTAGSDQKSDNTGFPLQVSIDQALGTVSLVTMHRSIADYGTKRVYFQNILCGMVTLAAGQKYEDHPDPNAPKQRSLRNLKKLFASSSHRNPQEQDREQALLFASNLQNLLRAALPAGKSIVVMATVNPVFGLTLNDMQFGKRGQHLSDTSATTNWQGPGESPLTVLNAGFEDDSGSVGLHGNVWASGHGPRLYLLYIVEPGTYTLTGSSVNGFKANMPGIGAGLAKSKSNLGDVVFTSKPFIETSMGTATYDPTYAARSVENCTLAIAGGPCVQATHTTVYDQTHAGGSYQEAMAHSTFGLNESTTLSRSFASFKVAAGEAVLVDGMFAAYPSATFDEPSCRPTAEGSKNIDNPYGVVQCGLKRYVLLRVAADKEEMLGTSKEYAVVLPELMKILASLKLRPLTVNATPGQTVPGLGQTYSLSNGK